MKRSFFCKPKRMTIPLWLALLLMLPIVHAGEQATRAVLMVRELVDKGEVAPGTTLKLMVKQGNIASFLGQDFELKAQWERLTGTVLDVGIMPQLASHEFIRSSKEVDITIARNREYPDLVKQGLITDLTPLTQRFGFTLSEDTASGYILPRLQAYFDDRIYAIPADGDMALLYLRQDLLQDEANRKRFHERYGEALKAPETWADYLRLVAFFNRPDSGFYGALEPREPLTAWMYWMPRYASQAYPNQYLFDEQMHPLIASPAGVRATENFVRTVPFSPPDILGMGKDYSYTLPFFLNGKGFATIITLAGAKLFNLDTSAVKGKFKVVPMPGNRVDGRLIRRSTLIYGNNIVIPRQSRQPLLAFLYAMWVTDPDVSVDSVGVKAGFADPFRYNHLGNARINAVYTTEALAVMRNGLTDVVPAGTGLPGDDEYIAALNQNLWRAAKGELTAATAMANTAQEWERITDRYGREKQMHYWRQSHQLYPHGREE
ncbi:ABC transporter substrate-binding protein [Sedimenticola sp.]|uniref:ABC transporter substrate-binding protein n=1 Tax=Sedimenticola sp. TaxID=1940285 RepID=UPI003D0EA0DB